MAFIAFETEFFLYITMKALMDNMLLFKKYK